MRIAFFGQDGSFNLSNIGGTNSLVRRIAPGIIQKGHQVDAVYYDSDEYRESNENSIREVFFEEFRSATNHLSDYDHVIVLYVDKSRIPQFMYTCMTTNSTEFHYYYLEYPENTFERLGNLGSKVLTPYGGSSLCISKRLQRRVSQFRSRTHLCHPPVPESYFQEKNDALEKPINILFLGRLDDGKGIFESIELIEKLEGYDNFNSKVIGTYWEEDKIARETHEYLNSSTIDYTHIDFESYTPRVDELVRTELEHADVFLQPYRKISSSIDTPLLILEAMAAGCVIFSRPLGGLPSIYGNSETLITGDHTQFVDEAFEKMINYDSWFATEKKRVLNQVEELNIKTEQKVEELIDILEESSEHA
ncbi:glycosyltransferase [Halobaculum rarum]|uniref:glycosyltransferase n=1 Tax=Halobaculum rarum TaxID=3075122 RepID=UPI0032AFD301